VKNPILFSIITPVYNCESYLKEAVQSVLDQTFCNWELIIIDDGSIDGSFKIANDLSLIDNRIKVLTHTLNVNKGVSATRNYGVSKSMGNWISLLDADDIWLPGKLQDEYEVIRSHPGVNFIYSYAKRQYENSFQANDKNHSLYGSGIQGELENPFRKMISGFITSTSAVTFKKDSFQKCGGFNEEFSFAEDTLLFHRLMEHGNIYFIDCVNSIHRIHSSSVFTVSSEERKTTARYCVYEKLLQSVQKENIKIVSYFLIMTGFKKILRKFVLYPHNSPKLVFTYLIKSIKNPGILQRHKLIAVFLFISEYFLSPFKLLWLKFK